MTKKDPNKPKGTFPSKHINSSNAAAIGRKGGLACKGSLAHKYAAQLREMKKKGDTDAQISQFVQRLEDPTANILHIAKLLDTFIKSNPEEHNKVKAMSTLIQLHRANFGDKHQNLNINVNIDVEGELGELDAHIAEVIKSE